MSAYDKKQQYNKNITLLRHDFLMTRVDTHKQEGIWFEDQPSARSSDLCMNLRRVGGGKHIQFTPTTPVARYIQEEEA